MSIPDESTRLESQPPVGIDLGTTYSLIAYVDRMGRPITLRNTSGEILTPSAVVVDDEEVIVGREAVKGGVVSPDASAECFKRDMGAAAFHRKVHNHEVPPEVLSAFVLERLKKDAQRQIGPVRRAVITVPAFFDETRRRATQEAGRLAGLEVLDIINEPTAAAVAYGYSRGLFDPSRPEGSSWHERIMVYDLGGGTFDVTILEIDGRQFRALATDGDVHLGGLDFDERLVNYVAEQFLAAHGVDPRVDPQDAAQLWIDVQEAKHTLSVRSRATVVCYHAGIRMRIEVLRSQFEEMIGDLVERTETMASLALDHLGLAWSDINRVLLVGGSSRVPMIGEMLRRLTGKEPDRSQSPDEAVAHGAALYAGMLTGHEGAAGRPVCELVNINSHSLGVVGIQPRTQVRTNAIVIPRNTPLPAQAMRGFTLARSDQRSVMVPVVEGESERPEECISLGQCVVRNLPPGMPQGTRIEVEYRYAANGRISVSARIPSVQHSAEVEIKRDEPRNLDDLELWRSRLLGRSRPLAPRVQRASPRVELDANNRAGVLERLDALYARVGQLAAMVLVPKPLARSRLAALTASEEFIQTQAKVREAQRARHAVTPGVEARQFDIALSQAKLESQQAEVRSQFAHLALGRECINASFYPPGVENEIDEIEKLQAYLKG